MGLWDIFNWGAEIIESVEENGLVTDDSTSEEREEQFDFEASEQGMSDEEIEDVKSSNWFSGWFN